MRDGQSEANATTAPRVQILHVAGCPLVGGLRETARRGLARVGCGAPIEELEGDYPSPTLLVDGIDVVTGRPAATHVACRLDVPTEDQVVAALRAALTTPERSRPCGTRRASTRSGGGTPC